jgi:hypothetical protein
MKTLAYVEIDIDYCSLAYGNAPCTAALGVTGDKKCFNTFKTCQDKVNFTNAPKTLRFAEATDYLPGDIEAIPSIKSISYTPQKIEPGKSLGQRASVNVAFADHRHSDTDLDKYYNERGYNPFERGTFWAKFRARNPYITGRPFRLLRGTEGQTLDEMETRHFIIESSSGPSTDGVYTLVAKDMLKIADGDRAQAPRKSNGTLLALLDDNPATTAFTLNPIGIGDLEYPASGSLSIGEEAMTFTRVGDNFTVVRGAYGTEVEEHEEDDLVQLMLVYTSENVADILYDLFVTYAEADPATIPLDEWTTEINSYINRVYGARIATPTAIVDLVNELIEQVGLVMWWDELAALIKLRSLRPVVAGSSELDDNLILQGSLKVTEQPNKRVSQVWVWFSQKNPLEELTREANYGSGVLKIDTQSEVDHGLPAIKKVFSRWIGSFNRPAGSRLGAQILSRYRDPPRSFKFSAHRFDLTLSLGRGFMLASWPLQDDTGAPTLVPAIVTSLKPEYDRYEIEAEEMLFAEQEDLEDTRLIVIDQTTTNINLRAVHDSIYTEPGVGEEILCVIEAGVVVGSTDPARFAFEVGDWPASCVITIQIAAGARIAGAGGLGGSLGRLGGAGGWALYARYAVTIENNGIIQGGGGGGGPAYIGAGAVSAHVGGGGGAGYLPGNPGASAFGGSADTDGYGPVATSNATAGTLTAGGVGGFANYDGYFTNIGGAGGAPATAGQTGRTGDYGSGGSGDLVTYAGGAAGGAVDGDSFITFTPTGTITGARIN